MSLSIVDALPLIAVTMLEPAPELTEVTVSPLKKSPSISPAAFGDSLSITTEG